jgi:transposase
VEVVVLRRSGWCFTITAIRWRAQQRETGDIAPKPCGGDKRSRQMEERAVDMLAIWEERRDITREELRLAVADKGMDVSVTGLHRFFLFAVD